MLTSPGTLVSRARTAATARRQSWSGSVTAASQTSASTVTATVWLLSLSMFRNYRCPRERRQRLLVRLDGLSRRHLVGLDDRADQGMPDHVLVVETNDAHGSEPTQLADRVGQPGRHSRRQIGLRRIAGDDHTRVLAHAGQEHLHL